MRPGKLAADGHVTRVQLQSRAFADILGIRQDPGGRLQARHRLARAGLLVAMPILPPCMSPASYP